jgi:hypothetical protein
MTRHRIAAAAALAAAAAALTVTAAPQALASRTWGRGPDGSQVTTSRTWGNGPDATVQAIRIKGPDRAPFSFD